jgi:hypothetical protein
MAIIKMKSQLEVCGTATIAHRLTRRIADNAVAEEADDDLREPFDPPSRGHQATPGTGAVGGLAAPGDLLLPNTTRPTALADP